MTRRRTGLALLLLPGLAGCGFTPVYAPGPTGAAAAPELGRVDVALIPNRDGQVLRQELQRRLERADGDADKRYTLSVGYSYSVEGEGILQDTSTTRFRIQARADWTLRGKDSAGTPAVTQGVARAMDAVNVVDQQYFATDLEADSAHARLAQQIADQITLQLATWFKAHPAGAQPQDAKPADSKLPS